MQLDPFSEPTEYSRTVKLMTEAPGDVLRKSLQEEPWCVAPGLVYTFTKLDRSLIELYKEDYDATDGCCRNYLSEHLLFDIPKSNFRSLSSGRELLIFSNEKDYTQFIDFCVTLCVGPTDSGWGIAAAHIRIKDPINFDNPAYPDVQITVLCPFKRDTFVAYAPEYRSKLDIIPTVSKVQL